MKALRLAATLLAALGSTSAAAQDTWTSDVFAGYSTMFVGATACEACHTDAIGEEMFHGWHAALGWGIARRLDLVLDASGHRGASGSGHDLDLLAVMAGPRFARAGGRVRPFVHLLGGLVRTKAGVRVFDVEIAESETDIGGAAGGGFDIDVGERWALRLSGDFRLVEIADGTVSDPRFSAGAVYRFGAR
jgi:hypothetical protein